MPTARFRAALAFAVTALLMLAPAAPAAESCEHSGLEATKHNLEKIERAVLCLVNRERTARGRQALRQSDRLERAAARHSRDMVRRGYFAHVSPTGTDLVSRARRTGYIASNSAWQLAENLGWGSDHLGTARSMLDAWMRSSGHRKNILRPEMEHLGVGLAFGTPQGGAGLTGTLLFGSRS